VMPHQDLDFRHAMGGPLPACGSAMLNVSGATLRAARKEDRTGM
jgi:hypothetical protein